MAKKRKTSQDATSVEEDYEQDDTINESDEEEDLVQILEPFNKEQLIDLLRTAASNDPKIAEEIHRVADLDPAHRKLFVHGLGWETTSEKLQEFFSPYGEIEDCNVVVDKVTGKSKGYGFLLFKHRKSARKALKEPQKKIESRMTACQLASAGPVNLSHSHHLHHHQPQPQQQQQQQQQQNQATHLSFYSSQDVLPRKIYVGNVHSEVPADRLLAFFSKYGEIEEGPLGFDKQTGKAKGYALFIYKTVEGARKALEEPNKNFEGHQLYCQKATDSNKLKAAAAAAAASAAPVNVPVVDGFNVGSNVPGGAGFSGPNGAMPHQGSAPSSGVYGQGVMGGAQSFQPGVPPIQAALAVLAAAGQNPAAFGIPPSVVASLNPGLAAMNAGSPAVPATTMPQAMPGFGMGNPGGYQAPQVYQANNPYQGPPPRPNSAVGPMGGYVTR